MVLFIPVNKRQDITYIWFTNDKRFLAVQNQTAAANGTTMWQDYKLSVQRYKMCSRKRLSVRSKRMYLYPSTTVGERVSALRANAHPSPNNRIRISSVTFTNTHICIGHNTCASICKDQSAVVVGTLNSHPCCCCPNASLCPVRARAMCAAYFRTCAHRRYYISVVVAMDIGTHTLPSRTISRGGGGEWPMHCRAFNYDTGNGNLCVHT